MDDAVRQAVAIVHDRALATIQTDRARLSTALQRTVDDQLVDELRYGLRKNARLTLNFHPDRPMSDGTSVAAGMLKTGEYRPQSMTGLSNGMRFAASGGDRARWERDLFGDTYDDAVSRRPVYGALDIRCDPFGGSPRFGSCFVVLAEHCMGQATLCVGDSHAGPRDVGTISSPVGVLAGIFEEARELDDLEQVFNHIVHGPEPGESARELDRYVEAQVHGTVRLERDVVAVVVDPSFADSTTFATLHRAAELHDFEVLWHQGSQLRVNRVPDHFRGPSMPRLAAEIAGGSDGVLDPAVIGKSAARIPYTPPSPTGDAPESPLQQHKYLWHCLLRFGHAAAEPNRSG